MVAELKKDSELFKEANPAGGSYGLLPFGTLMKITGEPNNGYMPVQVELDRGMLDGWVRADLLGLEEQEKEKEAWEKNKEAPAPDSAKRVGKKSRRLIIPQDERLLFRRTPSFFYGAIASPHFSLIQATNGTGFYGVGGAAGGDVGFFLAPDFPMRIEVLYNYLSGFDSTGNFASFGFLDIGSSIAYRVNAFEIYGRLSYGFGLAVSNLPGTLGTTFNSVSDLGCVWAGAGVGYRFTVSEVLKMTARLHYQLSFLQSPFTFQTIGLVFLFDLQG
jgi:hypothetical protein